MGAEDNQGAPEAEDLNHQIVVIDNGSYTVKGGFAGHDDPQCVLPNCVAKSNRSVNVYVGDQCEDYSLTGDMSQLMYQRSYERGYLNDWETQSAVWDRLFSEDYLNILPKENSLMVTAPVLNARQLQHNMNEVIFETYAFQSYYSATGPRLAGKFYALEHAQSEFSNSHCRLVVDSGFSYTHVVPVFDDFNINSSIRRVNIGGKALTNYLKQVVSYRHFNVMDETFVINQAKEKTAQLSLDFRGDLESLNKHGIESPLAAKYVLPDFKTIHEGYVIQRQESERNDASEDAESDSDPPAKPVRRATRRSARVVNSEEENSKAEPEVAKDEADGQVLPFLTERISVPELLFRPGNGGLPQGGVVDAIMQCVRSCHPDLQGPLLNNILVVGGNACIPNFRERLESQTREVTPDHLSVNVSKPIDPLMCTWRGASSVASSSEFHKNAVTKAEYEEYGHAICDRRFIH